MSETTFILASLALISALSLLLLSFFVMRIRREVIGINKKMSRIEELLIQIPDDRLDRSFELSDNCMK